jgi:hypothetical protein
MSDDPLSPIFGAYQTARDSLKVTQRVLDERLDSLLSNTDFVAAPTAQPNRFVRRRPT